jgi:AcrR family transcriptional regulator
MPSYEKFIFNYFFKWDGGAMSEIKALRINTQQERAAITADTIVEAAILALEENSGDLDMVSSSYLAKKSGFSVGSLYRYFTNKEDLYAKVWLYFISRLHKSLVTKINSFPVNGTNRQLMMVVLDHYFDDLSHRNSRRLVRIYRLCIRALPEPENIAKPIDVLIPAFIQAQKLNQTGTMRMMDEDELRVILRGALAMVRSDFLEQNPYFGSAAHKKLMLDSMVRLFQK